MDKQVSVRLKYLLYLPEGYDKDPDKKWPLILFLHGAGERGDNLEKVKIHGPPKLVEHGRKLPFIVVSPQCPADSWWEPVSLNALLDEVQDRHRVDPDRIYVTGLSMGGFGTWDLATRYPERFAAIAPICGGGNKLLVGRIKNVPVWAFHGDADPVVPVKRTDEMVEALKRAGGNVKYTCYPGVQHDSWTATYNNPELYEWFLSHKRGEKRPATQPAPTK
ncbi:MAG TPA: PHB depolymerase family esterase [Phycisphaerae bacterium]|nr:PHB depolymerase family esterase [Phycisphaerae bacterium]HQA44783.1 PHB depolymerase family esterase [Phycisphaerae bacterium]HQE43386.1 PHB depolymerase family esterase [Phycisphaerae bacterium]